MAANPETIPFPQSLAIAPEEVEALRAVMLRATRVACGLFGAEFGDIVLFNGDSIWRAGQNAGREWEHAPISASAPVRLKSGVQIGVLSVLCGEPLAHDERLAGLLEDLADGVGEACDRARLASDAAEGAHLAKSTFLATMSHEIRTPLNGVLGMAQALEAGELAVGQRERVRVIRESGETLLAILNDLLDLSKIEAGKVELEEIEFDLGEIARGADATFAALAGKKGLSFDLDIDAARGTYRGDPTRLRQVLYNLISNALKFTETGEIRVTAAYDGADLVATVADTGIGMSQAAMADLFTKFTQADTSTTRRFGGAGLGLAICKQLAELMGGAITTASQEGRGSTFVFRAPLARIGEGGTTEASAPGRPANAEGSGVRVLAAEDNSVNQQVIRALLQQVGVDPVIVENGKLAVEAWEAGDWDAILMDVQMPVMDGLAATRAIRAGETRTGRSRTPIIAVTANAMRHQVAEYAAYGMDGHVAKPIDAMKLFQALQAALDGDADALAVRAA